MTEGPPNCQFGMPRRVVGSSCVQNSWQARRDLSFPDCFTVKLAQAVSSLSWIVRHTAFQPVSISIVQASPLGIVRDRPRQRLTLNPGVSIMTPELSMYIIVTHTNFENYLHITAEECDISQLTSVAPQPSTPIVTAYPTCSVASLPLVYFSFESALNCISRTLSRTYSFPSGHILAQRAT